MTSTQAKETRLRLKWCRVLKNQDYFTETQIMEYRSDVRRLEKRKERLKE